MISTISIDDKEYQMTPMNAHEAAAVMFILGRYAEELVLKEKPYAKLAALLDKINEVDPSDLFRLLAYMLHIDADELIKPGLISSELLNALVAGLTTNSLPDLINVAYMLGIVKVPWKVEYGVPVTE